MNKQGKITHKTTKKMKRRIDIDLTKTAESDTLRALWQKFPLFSSAKVTP